MGFSLSPSVTVKEIDASNVVPGVATSIGAAVIEAGWGPVGIATMVDSENAMVQQFGKPNDLNAANWFAAANFLSYSNSLLIARSDTTNQRNAVSALTSGVSSVPIISGGTGYVSTTTAAFSAPPAVGSVGSVVASIGGTGYTNNAAAPLTFTGGGFTTVAVGTASIVGGVVGAITITTPGTGYTSAPVVTVTTPGAGVGVSFTVSMTTGGITATATPQIVGGVITGFDITNNGSGYFTPPTVTLTGTNTTPWTPGTVILSQGGIKINSNDHYTATYINGEAVVGEFAAKYPGTLGNSLRVSMADAASYATWDYKSYFSGAPNTSAYVTANGGTSDELHIVVIDKDGKWTGTAGTVLEKYEYLSKASDARKEDGSGAYYKNVINAQSNYVWWMDPPIVGTNWGNAATNTTFASIGSSAITRDLVGGVDHFTATDGQRMSSFALFADAETLDVSLVIAGKANATVANYVIQNLAEFRKDVVAFVSPENISGGAVLIGNTSAIADSIVAYRNLLPSSSYYMIDTGYKYQYDRYNDKYRWVPLNGDIAGLCARTDATNDPWFSPAGLNRGNIKNVVKLAYSPRQTDRDTLYKNGINPVVSFPGQGVILYGDKTGLSKPSAFDRVNVRRLFITLEKAIATAAKYQLFEMNDVQTRAQFKAMVEPFLRDVKGRRGIYDFMVLADDTNNTQQVIDTNRFVASIFISPAKSINFIELNFIATRTGVAFSEVAGQV